MLALMTAVLAGCGDFDQPISEDTTGFWSEFIVWPLVSTIVYFAELFEPNIAAYALSIIVVTIIIRLIILPLTIKQVKSSKQMQTIQPQIKALQEKYPSKDAVSQQKLQQEMMELYKTTGFNPFAGCLPIFIQMPILIGFYHAINRMNADGSVYNLGTFLSVPLGEPSIIFAVLAGIMQFGVLLTGPAMDNPQMKMMMYIMPVMIIGFGAFLPAALSMYWVVGNIISIIQNLIIHKPWKKKEVAAK